MLSLDFPFLLALLFEGEDSEDAWRILRRQPAPSQINRFHLLLLENSGARAIARARTSAQIAAATDGLRLWRQYLDEMVFTIAPTDYDAGLRAACALQRQHPVDPPHHLTFLWPALAVAGGATTFVSLTPATRKLAKSAGLKLLPEIL